MNTQLDVCIKRMYVEHAGRYGYRRICSALTDEGFTVSRERVRRRMCRIGLKGFQKRKFKHTTDSNHGLPIAPNRLNQAFDVVAPNVAWVADITYVRVRQQWLYLAVVLDLYSRQVIGWAFSQRINADLVCRALQSALLNRNHPKGVLMHTDRGSQYCSRQYQQLLKQHQLVCSMSGKGNCYDNAVCESFFHTLKVEHVYRQIFDSIDDARRSIFWYIEAYYNRKRKHSTLGYKSPVEFEKSALNAN